MQYLLLRHKAKKCNNTSLITLDYHKVRFGIIYKEDNNIFINSKRSKFTFNRRIRYNTRTIMVQAWYMDNCDGDRKLDHHRSPPQYISNEELHELTGIEYFKLNVDTYKEDGVLEEIKKSKGYTCEEESSCSKTCVPNYEENSKQFYSEHLHDDDEVRFILEGSCFFDVRDKNDEWIRVSGIPGDFIIIPAGIYHRCTLDAKEYVKGLCFFNKELDICGHRRPADDRDCRKSYLKKLDQGFGTFISQ